MHSDICPEVPAIRSPPLFCAIKNSSSACTLLLDENWQLLDGILLPLAEAYAIYTGGRADSFVRLGVERTQGGRRWRQLREEPESPILLLRKIVPWRVRRVALHLGDLVKVHHIRVLKYE